MRTDAAEKAPAFEAVASEPATSKGLQGDALDYMLQGGKPAEPSVINTNSKYLNNPYFRDAFAQLGLKRNGPDLPSTYTIPLASKAIAEVTDFAEFARLIEEEKAKNADFAQWMEARRFTLFTKDRVKDYLPGTLGHAVWCFLDRTGYVMDKMMLGDVAITNDVDYISQRRANIHDLEHLVTGFGPNGAGELALIWVNITSAANYFSPRLAQHISAGITLLGTTSLHARSLHYPEAYPTTIEAVRAGIAMGQALKRPLLVEPWEDMFDWPLDKIRDHLGIVPGPAEGWNWTTEANRG